MNTQPEIYPMPAFPTLEVRNLAASTRWYQEVINFQLIFEIPDAQGQTLLTHLRWAKYADLLLVPEQGKAPATGPKGVGVSFTFMLFEGSVDQLAAGAQAQGATILQKPVTQRWGVREVTIADPDGYHLVFGQRAIEQDFDQILDMITQG